MILCHNITNIKFFTANIISDKHDILRCNWCKLEVYTSIFVQTNIVQIQTSVAPPNVSKKIKKMHIKKCNFVLANTVNGVPSKMAMKANNNILGLQTRINPEYYL